MGFLILVIFYCTGQPDFLAATLEGAHHVFIGGASRSAQVRWCSDGFSGQFACVICIRLDLWVIDELDM